MASLPADTTPVITNPIAFVIYLLCLAAHPGDCVYLSAARVTEYVPAFGGINCEEPCNITASMLPVTYGVTAACGPHVPSPAQGRYCVGTLVYVESAGWRTCHDRGGSIDDDEVDVAIEPDEYLQYGIDGYHPVVWVFPHTAAHAAVTRSPDPVFSFPFLTFASLFYTLQVGN